jgi:glucose/mannose-6-phosphate isomerase
MKDLVAEFPAQLRSAVDIAHGTTLKPFPGQLKNVLITGLGGSGIGGTIAAELTAREAHVPVVVSKGYFIPAWVGEETLVIVSSFSGNTEETINAMQLAMQEGATIVAVTSGGKIADIAKEKGFDLITLPPGNSPRACLGYSLVQQLRILHHFGVIASDKMGQFLSAAELIEKEKEALYKEAVALTRFLSGKVPVIYTTTYREGIAIRLRQQLNENSKILCWHHVVPEMNHNELVGWRSKNEQLAVLLLRDKSDYERNQKRFEINKEVFSQYTPHIAESWAQGENDIEKAIWHIHLGDWISVLLAEERGVDAVEVKVIDHLKGELSKF